MMLTHIATKDLHLTDLDDANAYRDKGFALANLERYDEGKCSRGIGTFFTPDPST